MAGIKGMNSFILAPDVIEDIGDDPIIPVESFEILDGCEDPERSYDVPTGQTFSNGAAAASGRRRKKHSHQRATRAKKNHQGLGVLDVLPVSPQVIFTHGSGRDISQKGFVHFVRGLAREHAVLAFRRDRGVRGSRAEELFKRTAAFNYFFNDAYCSVRAMGGRSFGARAAARASVYSTNKNLILWKMNIHYDASTQQAIWTGWTTRVEDTKKQGVTVQLSAADDSKLSFQLQS
ncbi:hypothetical protein LA080_011359 [Diaporthe eres]|nr:hypothetical protein LA080_011359 [Diaporthe eres]